MNSALENARLGRCLDSIYDAAVLPSGWNTALSDLLSLFDAGFADVCAWTPDRKQVSGLSAGLDLEDYQEQFLGFWFNRNVWAKTNPVRVAGEVISTRQMVAREDLRRSEMYHEYLHPRGLHEGLRLSLWVDAESLADISLLRPWSLGAFGPAEVALGETLLPHLRRAANLTRRLQQSEFRLELGGDGGATGDVAAIAFDADGVPIWYNQAAEAALARGNLLRLAGQSLSAVSPEATRRLHTAVALASGRTGLLRAASTVLLPAEGQAKTTSLLVQPLSGRDRWSMPRSPVALALFRTAVGTSFSAPALQRIFGLTRAEAQVALDVMTGSTIQDVALRTGRSRNTIRTHLARLMEKTGTTRQVDLVRLLNDLEKLDSMGIGGPEARKGASHRHPPRRPTSRRTTFPPLPQ